MDPRDVRRLLEQVREGDATVADAEVVLRDLPLADLGYATVDHHRALRNGYPEVILGIGKTSQQIIGIMRAIDGRGQIALATRVTAEMADEVLRAIPAARYETDARCLILMRNAPPKNSDRAICIVTAGTGDLPVAEEAAITAQVMGNEVTRLTDVGVAGLHRLLGKRDMLDAAGAIIVVAGMDGALPSVVGGLVNKPVVAVPTSVGYGASFEGMAALLAMLNSCAAGVTVVNIDNGFGAAYAACLMLRTEHGHD